MRGALLGFAAGLIVAAALLASATAASGHSSVSDSSATFVLVVEDSTKTEYIAAASISQPGANAADHTFHKDPMAARQWAMASLGLPEIGLAETGNTVLVAVLDTGIDDSHEDLAGKVVAEKDFTGSQSAKDVNGHGTHVAGTIAATKDNGIGIAGLVPNAILLNVKVADDYGSCDAEAVARGIIWATDNGANVINVSLELGSPSDALALAVDYAWGHGAIIVAAAGNDASPNPVYPAFYAEAIAVGGVDKNDRIAPLSNYGYWVDVAAPGFEIYSTLPGDTYGFKSGTSFAAAQVSGLAAYLYNIAEDRNGDGRVNDEVKKAIESGCVELNGLNLGHGKIDFGRSLSVARSIPGD